MPPRVRFGLFATLLASLLACAHAGTPRSRSASSDSAFVSKEELRDLAGKAKASDVFESSTSAAEAWDLVGPFPTSPVAAPSADKSPFGRIVADALAAHPELMDTQSLACVARELGRFYLEKHAHAPQALQRFVRGRCMDVQRDLRMAVLTITHAGTDESALATQFHDKLVDMLASTGTGRREVGLWFERKGDDALVYIAAATSDSHVVSYRVTAGRAEIDLEILTPATRLDAVLNRGAFGFGDCAISAQLPRAHVVCAPDPGDMSTWVDVVAYPPGHILGFPVLDMLVSTHSNAQNHWRTPAIAISRPLDGPNPRTTFVAALNDQRERAGLQRVKLAPGECDALDAIAPVFFASVAGKAPGEYADLIALGTIAGWDVDGLVKSGAFASGVVLGTNDAATLIGELVSFPTARRALFDPAVTALAPAAILAPGGRGVAVLIGGYSVFGDAPGEADMARVWDALMQARALAGTPRTSAAPELVPLAAGAAKRIGDGAQVEAVLDDLLRSSTTVVHRGVRGWVAETASLGDIPFPSELVRASDAPLAVAVTWRKHPGEPWGRYVVLVVALAPPQQVALR